MHTPAAPFHSTATAYTTPNTPPPCKVVLLVAPTADKCRRIGHFRLVRDGLSPATIILSVYSLLLPCA